MMNIHYNNTITVCEVNSIRKAMGWRQILPEQMQEELDRFEFIVSAYDEDKAIGMATSDGTVLIIPEYQFIGIEDEFMSQIINFLLKKLKPGYGTQLDIRVWNERQIDCMRNLAFRYPRLKNEVYRCTFVLQIKLN
jgi:hypothetical protein